MSQKTERQTPFILRFAEKQKEVLATINQHYDEEKKVTVVQTKRGSIPLVKYNSPITELLTKTEASREADDYNSPISELELQTKTAKERESDESAYLHLALELKTKTFEEKEADDYNPNDLFAELHTKTKQLPPEGEDVTGEINLL